MWSNMRQEGHTDMASTLHLHRRNEVDNVDLVVFF